eukprot:4485929-Pyramimonas_sp.AAC.1
MGSRLVCIDWGGLGFHRFPAVPICGQIRWGIFPIAFHRPIGSPSFPVGAMAQLFPRAPWCPRCRLSAS